MLHNRRARTHAELPYHARTHVIVLDGMDSSQLCVSMPIVCLPLSLSLSLHSVTGNALTEGSCNSRTHRHSIEAERRTPMPSLIRLAFVLTFRTRAPVCWLCVCACPSAPPPSPPSSACLLLQT